MCFLLSEMNKKIEISDELQAFLKSFLCLSAKDQKKAIEICITLKLEGSDNPIRFVEVLADFLKNGIQSRMKDIYAEANKQDQKFVN